MRKILPFLDYSVFDIEKLEKCLDKSSFNVKYCKLIVMWSYLTDITNSFWDTKHRLCPAYLGSLMKLRPFVLKEDVKKGKERQLLGQPASGPHIKGAW